MTKLGAHIVQGSRNGYGQLCTAKPAVILSTNDGGALLEAWQNSGGHTYTIFRDTVLYDDAPGGIDQATPAQARMLAESIYPVLKAKWLQNPADYYTVLNEPAGNNAQVAPVYFAYEQRMMELAEADGFKLCVLNLAGGTPGDLTAWKSLYVPHIKRAFEGGHIYGRHCYGGTKLSVPDGNTNRAFVEAEHLRAIGLGYGGIVITEAGHNGGYAYIGDAAFVADVQAYNAQMMAHPNIIGACIWTLGEWQSPSSNWQTAIPTLSPWIAANPTPKWTPGEVPPPQPTLPKIVILKKPQIVDITKAENDAANDYAWGNYGRTSTHSENDMIQMLLGGDKKISYAIVAYPNKPSQAGAIAALQSGGYRWVEWPEPVPGNPLDGLRLSHILPYRYMLTSPFNAPRGYGNGLHEGIDLDVIGGLPDNKVNVLCTYDGIVDRSLNYGGYGEYVRVTHTRNGSTFYTRYAHLDARFVTTGNVVKAGDPLGEIGATGNALGEHVHFNLEVPVYGLRGYIVDWVVNPEPYMAAGRNELPSIPSTTTIDLLPYVKGDGRLYEVQTVGAGQERFQTQSSGTVFYQTKNSSFEELSYDESYIWRGLDISPGPAPAYAERPGVLRYYTAKEPNMIRARWCKKFMAIGETFTGFGHQVQFYYQDTCQPSSANSGPATNKTKLVAKHASKTWNGITVNDVVEMTNGIETWYFARGYGLVAWNDDKASSAISEVHAPGTRPDNVRAVGCWS